MSRSTTRFRIAVLLGGAFASTAAPSAAVEAPLPPVVPGSADAPVTRVRSEVTLRLDAASGVVRVEILEELRNNTEAIVEGDYMFPVPAGSAFEGLTLYDGETALRGEMMRAEKARAIYDETVRKLRDPALVELYGHGLVRARVFPIQPGQTRRIVLRYSTVGAATDGLLRLRHARTVTLFSSGGVARPLVVPLPDPPSRLETRTLPLPAPGVGFAPAQTLTALRVLIAGDDLGDPYSPSDSIRVTREPAGGLVVDVEPSADRRPFELLVPIRGREPRVHVVTHSPAPGREDGYFVLLMTPPARADSTPMPRDLTLMLDTSGSMSGHKLERAREAMAGILTSLRDGDRFRLLTFSSAVRTFTTGYVAATPESLADARAALESLEADGGTAIEAAIRAAFGAPARTGALATVLFLTDGLPTVGEADPATLARLASSLRAEERLFAFGLGEDVNTYLLDQMTSEGRGAVDYVATAAELEAAIATLSQRTRSPALADLEIVGSPVVISDLQPGTLPDLFDGQDLRVFGRYRAAGEGAIEFVGRRGDDTSRFRFAASFPREEHDNAHIALLWATRKAGELSRQIRLNGADPELVEELRQLGLRYGILTEYTAYLVQEPTLGNRADVAMQHVRDLTEPPREQSGAQAFRRAATSARQERATSLRQSEDLMAAPAPLAAAARAPAWQRVGRRLFRAHDGGHVDVAVDATLPVLRVAPFSAAWMAIAERYPDLRSALALGDRVTLAGEGLTLEVGVGGRSELRAADRTALASAFGHAGTR